MCVCVCVCARARARVCVCGRVCGGDGLFCFCCCCLNQGKDIDVALIFFIKVSKSGMNKLSEYHYATFGHYRMSGIRDSHNASLHLPPGLTLIIT